MGNILVYYKNSSIINAIDLTVEIIDEKRLKYKQLLAWRTGHIVTVEVYL